MSIGIFQSDVLIIGGGQAGLRAAIEARRTGAKVIMVSKGKIGAGGSSAISDTVHSAILSIDDSPEVFYQDIMKGGKQINKPELARVLAEDCTQRVAELRSEFGVELHSDQSLVTPGHSFSRRWYHKSGTGVSIVRQIRKYAEQIGVEFCEKTTVVDLLSDSDEHVGGFTQRGGTPTGRVIGALAIVDNEWVAFTAGSTVLAAGGVGRIYAQSDNPIDICGDGVAMAWRHGAELQDMEFVQFYPYRLVSPINIDLYTKLFGNGAMMRNQQGERFLEEFPRKELETRDVVCYTMFKQEKVLLDLSHVKRESIAATTPRLHSLLEKEYNGELLMQPVEHYSIGGISIDAEGRTARAGLYACGECTGGVHGANRLGGGALTEALVFGARAGAAAATEAVTLDSRLLRNLSTKSAESQLADFVPDEKTKEQETDIRKRLQHIMWNKVGIERSESGLQAAFIELKSMREEAAELAALRDMVDVAGIIARSAFARKESRGAHQVLDYPEQRNEWHGNLIIKGETVTFQPHPLANSMENLR